MWSGWRYVLRIRLAQATEPARGFHALFKCCEAAICGTAKSVAINRAPRIVLSFCWSVQHSCCDDNTERKQDKSHPYLPLASPNIALVGNFDVNQIEPPAASRRPGLSRNTTTPALSCATTTGGPNVAVIR